MQRRIILSCQSWIATSAKSDGKQNNNSQLEMNFGNKLEGTLASLYTAETVTDIASADRPRVWLLQPTGERNVLLNWGLWVSVVYWFKINHQCTNTLFMIH